MRVSEGTLADIKSATDIVELVSAYVPLKRRGKTFLGLCPFHDDHAPSFDVDPERQRYRCWACGQHGDVFQFLIEQEKVGFIEAAEMLADRAGIRLQDEAPQAKSTGPSKNDLLRVLTWATELFRRALISPLGETARTYLEQRGFTDESVSRFGIGVAPDSPQFVRAAARRSGVPSALLEKVGLLQETDRGPYEPFRNRIVFPIRDALGRVIGFGGRVLDDSKPKYKNSPETVLYRKGKTLYALDLAKKDLGDAPLIVMEGYTDVMMCHQAGLSRAIGCLGTALTLEQAKLIRRYTRSVCLFYDGDKSGRAAVEAGTENCLRAGLQVLVASPPDGLDPCDLVCEQGAGALEEVVSGARDYFVDRLDVSGLDERQRAELAASLLGKINCIDDVLLVDALVPQIASRLQLREAAVRTWLKQGDARRRPVGDGVTPERKAPSSRREIAGRELLREALHFPHLAEIIRREMDSGELEDLGQRLLFEAIVKVAEGTTPPGNDDVTLLLEDTDARRLAHRLLGEPAGEASTAEERVQASLEFLRRDRAGRELSDERARVLQTLGEEGDEGEKDRVMTDYLDRLREEAGRRRSRT